MMRVTSGPAIAIILSLAGGSTSQAQETKGPPSPLDIIRHNQAIKKNPRSNNKVILGTPAPAGAYPFQVSLIDASSKPGEEFNAHFCGATLIAPTWILTAAHCVTVEDEIAKPSDVNVYVGSQNFKSGDRIAVKSVFRHPDYVASVTENDVALLQLARVPKAGIKFSTVDIITKDNEATYTKAGTQVSIVGWGTTENDQLSQRLLQASIKLVERAVCNGNILKKRATELPDSLAEIVQNFRINAEGARKVREAVVANAGPIVSDAMICAGEPSPAPNIDKVRDTCQGDSGGPLLAKTEKDAFIQVGIVSWGEGCGIPKLHGIYTRLALYADWVKTTMKR
jgi:secreted trypsin-like serine protease